MNDLRTERAAKGVSLTDLSEASGISEPTLSKIFSGKSDNPTLQTICDVAAALEMEIRAVKDGVLDSLPPTKAVDVDLYNRLLVEKDKRLQHQDRTIQVLRSYVATLFCVLLVVVVGLSAVLLIDHFRLGA